MTNKQINIVVKGALLLTLASLLSKALSATYRIPLQNLTGDLGFYIYQQVYPIIGTVMILTLYGFPVAISSLILDKNARGEALTYREFYLPLLLVLYIINGAIFLVIVLLAQPIAVFMHDEQLISTYKLAAVLFLFVPLLALLRGNFLGFNQLKHLAISQVFEQLIRVLVIVGAAYLIFTDRLNIYEIGNFGVIATIAGMLFATISLAIFFRPSSVIENKTRNSIPWGKYFSLCFTIGLIASLQHMILIIVQTVDVFTLVPYLIDFGIDSFDAKAMKGVFDRGQPLIQFGIVFGSSFALALIPNIHRDRLEQSSQFIREAFTISLYLSAGATIGLMLLFPVINELLFMDQAGTKPLQILVIAIIFSSLAITGSTILQRLGYLKLMILALFITLIVKIVLNKWLIPQFGIYGSSLATVGSMCVLVIIVFFIINRNFPALGLFRSINWRGFLAALIAMGGVIVCLQFLFRLLAIQWTRFGLLIYVALITCIGAMVYGYVLLKTSVLTRQQLEALPFADHLIKLQNKYTKEA